MFSLLLGLWNHLFTKAEVHILIAGLDDAGKTVRTISAVCFLTLSLFGTDAIGAIKKHLRS